MCRGAFPVYINICISRESEVRNGEEVTEKVTQEVTEEVTQKVTEKAAREFIESIDNLAKNLHMSAKEVCEKMEKSYDEYLKVKEQK